MSFFRAFAICLVFILTCSDAQGFNELGHSVIARIAYGRLSPAQRAAIHDVLKRHPHYAEYLIANKPPEMSDEEVAFMRAGTWGDWIRNNHRDDYHKSEWHYVNHPYRMGQDVDAIPARLEQATHIRERLPKTITMVRNGGTTNPLGLSESLSPAERRAIALTWMFHLIGDMHQPLHLVAMVDDARWPAANHGDQGGNLIAVVVDPPKAIKLHAYWDGVLGLPMSFENVGEVVDSLMTDPPLASNELLSIGSHMDFDDWIADGYRLAVKYCYLNGSLHLSPWRDAYFKANADADVPVLPQSVRDSAKTIYRRQLLISGERLGNQLKRLF